MRKILTVMAVLCPTIGLGATDQSLATCGVDLSVRFVEGAPVDRFIIANGSTQGYALSEVAIDLSQSKGKLIFDTVGGGAGVEVFQPFASSIADVDVQDGATGLRLPMNGLAGGADVSFTIDVDDQLTASELGQIRVSGSEMAGAQVVFAVDSRAYLAHFDDNNIAQVTPQCGDSA